MHLNTTEGIMETKTTMGEPRKIHPVCCVALTGETVGLKYCPKYVLFRKNWLFWDNPTI